MEHEKEIYSIICDIWKLYKQTYQQIVKGSVNLDAFSANVDQIYKQHNQSEFAHDVLLAVMNQISRDCEVKNDR